MRDRREVLKLLAGGTAVAAGASLVTTSTAFADGGTASKRPDCETLVGSVAYNADSPAASKKLTLVVTPGNTSCPTGWSPRVEVILRLTTNLAGGLQARAGTVSGTSIVSSGSSFGVSPSLTTTVSGAPVGGRQTYTVGALTIVIGTPGTSVGDIGTGNSTTSIGVEVIVRKTCTTAGRQAAYCCSSFARSANYIRNGGSITWAGALTGSVPLDASSGVSTANGCLAP